MRAREGQRDGRESERELENEREREEEGGGDTKVLERKQEKLKFVAGNEGAKGELSPGQCGICYTREEKREKKKKAFEENRPLFSVLRAGVVKERRRKIFNSSTRTEYKSGLNLRARKTPMFEKKTKKKQKNKKTRD